MPHQPSQTPETQEKEAHVLAVSPFASWTYKDAHKAVADILPEDYSIAEAYVIDKDHFQDGKEWVGPGDGSVNERIDEQFAPEDAIGEVLSNVENAFSEPQIGGVAREGTGDVTTLMDELTPILSKWWMDRRMQEVIQNMQRTAAWAGWSDLRLFIPHRFLVRNADESITVKKANSVEEALKYLFVTAPQPKNAAIITHVGTQDSIAIYLDVETVYKDGKREDFPRAELVYLDPDRENDEEADTIIRVVYSNDKKPGTLAKLKLGGRLMTAEMKARKLITNPVMRTQRQLNLLTTIITRIGETAAFRERYVINARPQGVRIPWDEGDKLATGAFLERDDEGRQWQVVPEPRTLGASTTTELVGLPVMDSTGQEKGNADAKVIFADPVDPGPYQLAADGVRRRILRMCSQGHLGGVSNAESSGIAYEQARAVFEKDLIKRKIGEEGTLRQFLTTVVKLAEVLSGQDGKYTNKIRLTVDQNIDPGPRSPDLVRLDLEALEAGVLSKPTVMMRIGITDTEAELARIEKSTTHIMSVLEQAVASSTTFTTESIIEVMKILGLPDDIINALEVKEEPEPTIPVVGGDPNAPPTGGE